MRGTLLYLQSCAIPYSAVRGHTGRVVQVRGINWTQYSSVMPRDTPTHHAWGVGRPSDPAIRTRTSPRRSQFAAFPSSNHHFPQRRCASKPHALHAPLFSGVHCTWPQCWLLARCVRLRAAYITHRARAVVCVGYKCDPGALLLTATMAAATAGTDAIPSGNFSSTDGNLASARAPDVVVCFQCGEHTVDDDVSAGMCEECYTGFIEHRCGGCGRRLAEVPLALQSPTRGSTRMQLQASASQPPVFARDGGDSGDSDGDGAPPIIPIQRSVSSADGASRKSAIADLIPVPRRGSDSLLDEDEPAGGSSAIQPARTPSRSTRVPVRAGKGRASLRRQLTVGLAGATFTPPLSSPRNICAMAVAEVASPLSQPIGADTVEAFDRKWHRHCLRLFHPGHNVDVATLSSPAHKTPVAVLASSASTARKALFGAKGDSVDPLAAQLGASRTYVFYPSSDDDDDEETASARRSPEPNAVDDASTGAGGAGAGVGHSSSRVEATPPHLPPHSRRISAPVVTHASLAALVSPPPSRRHSASVTSIQSMSSQRSVERARKAVAAQHPAKQLRRRSRRRSSVFFTRNAKQLIQRIKVMGLVADRCVWLHAGCYSFSVGADRCASHRAAGHTDSASMHHAWSAQSWWTTWCPPHSVPRAAQQWLWVVS